MKKAISILITLFLIFPMISFSEEVSSGTALTVKEPQQQPDSSQKINELDGALLQLNLKIENLANKFDEISRQVESAKSDQKEQNDAQKRLINEQNEKIPSQEKIKSLEASLELLRSDVTQVREDVGIIKSQLRRQSKDTEQEKWYQAKWIAPVSLGIAFIALVKR